MTDLSDALCVERALAYSAARSDIEVYGRPWRAGLASCQWCWFDVSDVGDDADVVQVAVDYLASRGLLVRYPGVAGVVRVLPASETGALINEEAA